MSAEILVRKTSCVNDRSGKEMLVLFFGTFVRFVADIY